jgi:hypothetical protein
VAVKALFGADKAVGALFGGNGGALVNRDGSQGLANAH